MIAVGFFKDLRTLTAQGKAIEKTLPPMKDRMADASARMAEANQMMAAMAQGAGQATSGLTSGVAATANCGKIAVGIQSEAAEAAR